MSADPFVLGDCMYEVILQCKSGSEEGTCSKFEIKGSCVVMYNAFFYGMKSDVLIASLNEYSALMINKKDGE